MKKIIVILLFITTTALSQPEPIKNAFVELAIDPKMAVLGPYPKDHPQYTNGGTLNFEIKVGFEKTNFKAGAGFESHKAINYYKGSVFVDWKFNNTLAFFIPNKNFISYIGPEASMIIRRNVLNNVYGMRSTEDWIQLGFNAGIIFIINETLELGSNFNMFRAEQDYRKYQNSFYKQFRKDFMLFFKVNF